MRFHPLRRIVPQNCWPKNPAPEKESSNALSGISAADLAREKKVVAAIHAMIKSKYVPMGVNARFNGGYNRSEPNMQGNGYSYSIMAFGYYCDGNNIKTEDETSTNFEIAANIFDSEIYDTAQGDRLLAEGFNVMHDMPVEKDGYWYFKEIDADLGFGMKGKSCAWLITYDGKLPYTYVTKKEFLEKRKRSLSAQMLMSAAGFKDNLKNIEIEKELTEKDLKNDPEKLKRYIKLDYQYKKDKYQKFLADNEKPFKPAFENIEKQLQMSAEILNQKAIVKRDPNDTYNYLFTDENDPFGEVLVKPNSGYFNKNLPKSSPQFFWIYMVWNHNEPIASMFKENSMKAVDFTALKNMLGK